MLAIERVINDKMKELETTENEGLQLEKERRETERNIFDLKDEVRESTRNFQKNSEKKDRSSSNKDALERESEDIGKQIKKLMETDEQIKEQISHA